ncbi:hypothetical protein [Streptomyces sp. NPDC093094]|uniref:hypothetical protein n=1 Tax=Streptomyces sp. NPDC093094 TaxID=3366026 RepID=UPI00382F35A4
MKLTAFVRISLRRAEGHGSTARLRDPMHKRFAAVAERTTDSGRRSGVFEEGPLPGPSGTTPPASTSASPRVVAPVLQDCADERLLPWSWVTEGFDTCAFDANARFTALIDGMRSAYSLLVMREGHINRLVVLDRATMAGTTQNICLNPA